jgi:hypothetical protein
LSFFGVIGMHVNRCVTARGGYKQTNKQTNKQIDFAACAPFPTGRRR